MKFKYNFLAITLLGAMAVACDPMDDIYTELDSEETHISKSEEEYVLVKSDYEAISKAAKKAATNESEEKLADKVKSELALNDFASADKFVPELLAKMYPSWGKGSTVGVTYNFHKEQEGVIKYMRGIKNAFLKDADYDAVWKADGIKGVSFFSPKHAPAKEIPGVLANKYPEAKKYDKVVVDYKYDTVDPEVIPGKDLINEVFDGAEKFEPIALEGWKQIQVKNDKSWECKDFQGNQYAQVSAFKAKGDVEVALVTPTIKIASAGAKFTFDVAYGHYKGDCLHVYVSDKYKGGEEFVAADWKEITDQFSYPKDVDKKYTDWINCGEYELDSFKGKDVTFAFSYVGAGNGVTTTVQLDNVKVSTTQISESNEKPYNALYQFDGKAWTEYQDDEVILVAPADYDAMGAPGGHDNFSNNDKADDYLPNFLALKCPYAKPGESKVVIYKFYTGKETRIYSDQYILGEAWARATNIEVREKETFLHNGEKWLFDPSIAYMITTADYGLLVNWVKENKPAYMDKKYDNSEYWFGGSTHYNNFNVQLFKRRDNDPEGLMPKDDEAAKAFMTSRIAEGIELVLTNNYPNSPTQMNGVDLYYNVSCKVYDGATNFKYTFKFKSLGNGKFELEGEPKIVNW